MKKIISIFLAALLTVSVISAMSVGAAELTKLDKTNWSITASSEIHWGIAGKMIDGDDETYWHTNYIASGDQVVSQDTPPYTIEITMPKAVKATALLYTPRQSGAQGRWEEAEVFVSSNGKGKGDSVAKIEQSASSSAAVTVPFGKELEIKKLTIVITKSSNNLGACAELDLLSGDASSAATSAPKTEPSTSTESKKEDGAGEKKLDKTKWSITASSEIHWGTAGMMIDGDTSTNWHTNYIASGDQVVSQDTPPYTIEITLPKAEKATALLYTPRQNGAQGRWEEAEVFVSADGKGKGDSVAKIERSASSADAVTIPFGKELDVKKLTIVITKSSNNLGACAELDLLSGTATEKNDEPEVEPEDSFLTKDWKITASSEMHWGKIANAFDGDKSTIWHTYYENDGSTITKQDTAPYTIDITLPEIKEIAGFTITGRENSNAAGRINAYELYASDKDEGDMQLILSEKCDSIVKNSVDFSSLAFKAKRLRLVITDSQQNFAIISELEFKKATDEKVYSIDEFLTEYDKAKLVEIDKGAFLVECSEEKYWSTAEPKLLFDGTSSGWQTEELDGITPVTLTVDLGKEYTVNGISILPRQTLDYHGYWREFSLWAGNDKGNMSEILTDYTFGTVDLGKKKIIFDEPVKARYFEFEITKYSAERVSCAEISFLETKAENDKTSGAGRYVMKIGSNEIEITKGGESFTKTLDTAPYITSAGRTLIPLRGLLEEMGAVITWTDEDQSIEIEHGAMKVYMQIRQPLVSVYTTALGEIKYTLESAPRIKDSRTFVPVRFLSEQFGYNVSWDASTQTITIEK